MKVKVEFTVEIDRDAYREVHGLETFLEVRRHIRQRTPEEFVQQCEREKIPCKILAIG